MTEPATVIPHRAADSRPDRAADYKFSAPRPASPSATRARRARARKRQGLVWLRLLRHERRLAAALRAADRLGDGATTAEIEAALGGVVDDFCSRWLGKI